ncbi:uncharacterized protein LOC117566660 [Drosophila albomicans]|uniref:Uncharacterized protein LOC117566660 n=1 Tax=Drosophila albomicans TaxID=7291 RepID=A0A6P8WUL2_DROAB|nr:uncharacterized protein LOC117566660 [Drosophila albomicans]
MQLTCLLQIICLLNINYANLKLINFTNITCETMDTTISTIEYCYIGHVNELKNYMSLRYALRKPIIKDIGFHLQLMIRSNGWKPFLYGIDIDMCRFWKSNYNAIAKLVFSLLEGHTNINHSCPYKDEKYIFIDNLMNTDISRKIRGLPFGKGLYALNVEWSWKNISRVRAKIYFEVLKV